MTRRRLTSLLLTCLAALAILAPAARFGVVRILRSGTRLLAWMLALVAFALLPAAAAHSQAGPGEHHRVGPGHVYDGFAANTTSSDHPRTAAGGIEPRGASGAGASIFSAGIRRAAKAPRALPRMAGGAPLPGEIVRPGGQLIGQPGTRAGIREVDDATQVDDLFEQIRAHGTPTKSNYPGDGYDLPGGGFVGRRTSESYGPTLDINGSLGIDVGEVRW